MEKILIVDDETHIRNNLREFLEEDYEITDVDSIEKVDNIIENQKINYAIIDLKLDSSSEYGGIGVFSLIKQKKSEIRCIILSAYPLEGEVEREFNELLKNEANANIILKEAKENYISKGGEKNYILAVIDKLAEIKWQDSPAS